MTKGFKDDKGKFRPTGDRNGIQSDDLGSSINAKEVKLADLTDAERKAFSREDMYDPLSEDAQKSHDDYEKKLKENAMTFEDAMDVVEKNKGKKITHFYIDSSGNWFVVDKIRFNDMKSAKGLWLLIDYLGKSGKYYSSAPVRDLDDWNDLAVHGRLQSFDIDGSVIDVRASSSSDEARQKYK